jgi:hypothetical protein
MPDPRPALALPIMCLEICKQPILKHNGTPPHLHCPVEEATCAVDALSQCLHQHHGWLVGQLQQLAQQPLKCLRMLRVDRGVLVAAWWQRQQRVQVLKINVLRVNRGVLVAAFQHP